MRRRKAGTVSSSVFRVNIVQNVTYQIDIQSLREGFHDFVFPLRSSLRGLCVKLRSIFSRKGRKVKEITQRKRKGVYT
jgi:hypothetical protein